MKTFTKVFMIIVVLLIGLFTFSCTKSSASKIQNNTSQDNDYSSSEPSSSESTVSSSSTGELTDIKNLGKIIITNFEGLLTPGNYLYGQIEMQDGAYYTGTSNELDKGVKISGDSITLFLPNKVFFNTRGPHNELAQYTPEFIEAVIAKGGTVLLSLYLRECNNEANMVGGAVSDYSPINILEVNDNTVIIDLAKDMSRSIWTDDRGWVEAN